MKRIFMVVLSLVLLFSFSDEVYALTGVVNVNDYLYLRSGPSSSSSISTSLYNNTEVDILSTNAGSGSGCDDNWYKISYGGYTGYSCGTFIDVVVNSDTSAEYDDSYSSDNYSKPVNGDGTVMCYEDVGSLPLRSSAGGSKTGSYVDCGQVVTIEEVKEVSKYSTCDYWYKINTGSTSGYVCGYFVNTTKLTSFAVNYYKNKTNGDTLDNYKDELLDLGFPSSYHSYLLEIHARHPDWNFVAEQINLDFDEVIDGEAVNNRNLLEYDAFGEGYLSTNSYSYDILSDSFIPVEGEDGYYNASREAVAYYMDPRNYLNEKYIFAFETLGYSSNQNESVVKSILSGQSFWPSVYSYYDKSGSTKDSNGSVYKDVVAACSSVGVSAVHVASRIKQEISGLSVNDCRIGGGFTYGRNSLSGYYNFFNIKSDCTNCSSIYAGYAYEKGWNTPYKGIYGGARFLYDGYISINQDTIYYEKFDVSTNNGHFAHQFMQNLAAPVQEGGIKYKGYVNGLSSYLEGSITFVIPVYDNMPSNAVVAPSVGNPNNYLKSLTVGGKNVSNFSYDTYNYKVYLNSDVTSVSIAASTINSNASVSGVGNVKINSNEQVNSIYVTAENGKVRKYTITFIRDESSPITVSDAMNNSGFKYNDSYLFGVNVGDNVSSLIGNITSYNNSVDVVVKNSSGKVKTKDSFRTGDTVTVVGSDGSKTYTVVIFGDVNGDGLIDKKDLLSVQSHVFGYTKYDTLKNYVTDINKDGKVDKKDLLSVQSHVFGYSKINQG